LVSHDSQLGQKKYLQKLMEGRKNKSADSSILVAIPIYPGQLPSFPGQRVAKNYTLQKLKDLTLTTHLPQHQIDYVGGKKYLLSAMKGQFLEGYVLILAHPFSSILDETRKLNIQAILFSVFMLLLTGLIAVLSSRLLLHPINELESGLLAVKARNFQVNIQPGSIRELAVVGDRFNKIISELQEMELAKSVQETLWPGKSLSGNGWYIYGKCITATHLGGDHHDWFELSNGNLVFTVGDVAGHGIPSALIAASAKTSLGLTVENESDPAKILCKINQIFFHQVGKARTMTLWLGIFKPQEKALNFSSAGQSYPILLSGANPPIFLEGGGYPLGSRGKGSFPSRKIVFEEPARLIVYSDGIIEATNFSQEYFGYERMLELCGKTRTLSPELAIDEIFANVRRWSGRTEPEDDQTLVVLDVGKSL